MGESERMTEELKPCPFCGHEDMSVSWRRTVVKVVRDENILGTEYMIRCRCGAAVMVRMKECDNVENDLPTATEAARIATERWNRRVIE